ncbi:Acetyl-coenzyme A transporter 1 [Thelohanellus kitauei]|uniref:Acetyl-coenzyme A transporter 1 n=1 Tax=Thelohanellus kitauei TaxID=669202 RepID=A0A0C2MH81_THEKT|nr:Acetyl-coenzyme A transporter 1 [Thelohanellus kitauei]
MEPDCINKDHLIKEFYPNFLMLIVLYCLQGLPLGLADIFPYIIQTLGASYKDLARFSITTWPFSLKILWAPFVDGVYIKSIGQRKTWIFITQLAIGCMFIYLSSRIDYYFSYIKTASVLNNLIFIFTFLIFLAATQDIAVDGWGLNLFPRSLISYASFSNTVGQTIGYLIGNTIFLLITSPINLPIFKSNDELVSESSFMFAIGILFIVITISILIFKHEESSNQITTSTREDITKSYKELFFYIKQPFILKITLMLLTIRVKEY